MVPVFARTRPQDLDLSVLVLLAVVLAVRGAQPTQFYVQLAATALAVVSSIVSFRNVPHDIHKALRVEWLLLGGTVMSMVFAETLPQDSQGAAVVVAAVLAGTLVLRVVVRGTVFMVRANRTREPE